MVQWAPDLENKFVPDLIDIYPHKIKRTAPPPPPPPPPRFRKLSLPRLIDYPSPDLVDHPAI